MRNLLLGTTALTTAGLIAGVTESAAAAERLKVAVRGFHQQWLVGVEQDYKNNNVSGAQRDTNLVDNKHNSEICFIGETTLDNGITFGINVQLEANTVGEQIDESYMYVQGARLGRLILGDENNAGYLLHVNAPHGGVSVSEGDMINNQFWVNPGLNLLDRAVGTTNLRFGDDDSGKVTYITPRFAGVQLGVSFIPQFEAGGGSNSSRRITDANQTDGNSNNINNGWAGGINYTEDFNGLDIMLSGGILYGDNGADSVTGEDDDLFAYNFGARISYAGFALGGAFSGGQDGGGGTSGVDGVPAQRANSRAWTVGANYSFGSYVIGATYMKGEENPTNNAGKGRLDQANISGTYRVGPGISLVGGLFWYDGENEDNSQENDGYGGAVGFKIGF